MSKKIVHIVLNPFIQDSRVIRECKTLANEGYDVTVIAYWMEGLRLEEIQYGYRIHRLNINSKPWIKNPLIQIIKYLEFLIKALFLIRKIKPDICHGHDPSGLFVSFGAKILWNCNLIYDSHELWGQTSHMNNSKKVIYKIGGMLEKLIMKYVDAIITVNNSIANIIKKKSGKNKVYVIRNISETSPINNKYSKSDFKLSDIKYNMIYIGSLSQGRGVDILLKSMVEVNNHIGLSIVGGETIYKVKYSNIIIDLGLNGRVQMIPAVPQDDVVNLCRQFDLGIHPIQNTCLNHYYCLPNKIFQYIQAGIPILCSDFPEMSKIIREYNIGEVFNIDNVDALAEIINNYFNNPEQMKIQRANSIRAAKSLNWNREEKKLLELYKIFDISYN